MKQVGNVVVDLYWKNRNPYPRKIGNTTTEYALINSDYQQAHQFVYCREFVLEVLFGYMATRRIKVNQFEYGFIDKQLSVDKTRVLVRDKAISKSTLLFDMRRALAYVNILADFMRVTRTTVIPVKIQDVNYYIFEGDKLWSTNPYYFDLYMMMLQIGDVVIEANNFFDFCHEVGESSIIRRDLNFLSRYAVKIRSVLGNREAIFAEDYNWKEPFTTINFFTRRNIISLMRGNIEDNNVYRKTLDHILET